MEYILGIIVSLLAQGFKKSVKGDKFSMYVFVAALSVVFAGVYELLGDAELWVAIVTVLTTAGAFHNFIIRRFEDEWRRQNQ